MAIYILLLVVSILLIACYSSKHIKRYSKEIEDLIDNDKNLFI